MNSTSRLLVLCAAAALAATGTRATAAQQSREQQACIYAINKDAVKVGKAQGKENAACVKAGTKGETVDPSCPSLDLKQKVAKKISKALSDHTGRCSDAPTFAYTPPGTASLAYRQAELDLLADVFGGTDLSGVFSPADSDISGCQRAVSKSVEKVAATAAGEFVKCKKGVLKTAVSAADIESCVGSDAKDKIARAALKLSGQIDRKCGAVAIGATFPGACSGSAVDALGNCLAARARCRMCQAANTADGLSANCDSVDDGSANLSCP